MQIQTIIIGLARHEIQFVLFGSLAAIAHGANHTTQDADICPALSVTNLRKIGAFMQEFEGKPKYQPNNYDLTPEFCAAWQPQPYAITNYDYLFETAIGDVDVCPYPYGSQGKLNRFCYETLNAHAVTQKVFGVKLRVAHIYDVVTSKLSAQRQKDQAIMEELQRVQALIEDGETLAGLERYQT